MVALRRAQPSAKVTTVGEIYAGLVDDARRLNRCYGRWNTRRRNRPGFERRRQISCAAKLGPTWRTQPRRGRRRRLVWILGAEGMPCRKSCKRLARRST